MAKYGILSLNYVAAGEKRLAVNLDSVVGYELSAVDHALSTEQADGAVAVEPAGSGTAVRAVLSCCSDRMRREISAFNSTRVRRNRSFVVELGQREGDRNALAEGGLDRLPMYDMVDEALKTAEEKPASVLPKIGEAQRPTDDEYVPQLRKDPLQFGQVGERTYFMTEPTAKAYQNLRIDIDPAADEGSEFYRARLVDNDTKTYLYASAARLSAEDYFQYFSRDNSTISALQGKIDGFFQPADEITGLEYNHLFGMLNGRESEYDGGNVYGDTYQTKNMYDATYSMDMASPDRLERARQYDGMCVNGGAVYLKYRDDVQYSRSGAGWQKSVPESRTYQKVERFQPVKSQDIKRSRHKSNYFSIRLNGIGLDGRMPDEEQEAAAEALRFNIEQAVRKITRALAPANTQLFEVIYGEGGS